MGPSHWTNVFRPFEMRLGAITGGRILEGDWKIWVSKSTKRRLEEYRFPKSCSSWNQIYSHTLLEMTFAQNTVSECAMHCNVNQSQDTPPWYNNDQKSTAPKEAALAYWTSVALSAHEVLPSPKIERKLILHGDSWSEWMNSCIRGGP
jgi:hypothetical protein